jgi:putative spermidine/putrescine transport system ATP-binding protein
MDAPLRGAGEAVTLAIENLTKRYPSGRGITGVSLRAERGEIIALVGPSGCGKTTLLRVVAGLAPADSGRVVIGGRDVTGLPPEERRIGLVFQSYALFPHLSVFENVAYGLRARGRDDEAIGSAVRRALEMVNLADRDGRVDQLSGGEQQRVAVARAVVTEPDVLLLDEPLSNLDPGLRHRMRISLRTILKKLATPSLHVTHDQEEALAIADRIAVLDAGRLAQVGTPDELYRRPRSAFVARFVGHANVVRGRVARAQDGVVLVLAWDRVPMTASGDDAFAAGDAVELALRPESLELAASGAAGSFEARVRTRTFLGAVVDLRCEAGGDLIAVRLPSHGPAAEVKEGDSVRLCVGPAGVHAMTPSAERT